MVTPINEENGVVAQAAIDKQKNLYEIHPKTGTKIKGFQIPYWNEVIELCKKLVKKYQKWGILVGM